MRHLSERLERVKAAVLPTLSEHFGSDQFEVFEHRGELTIRIPRERLLEMLAFLRDEASLRFDMLKDLCAVDWYRRANRFELVYNLHSLQNRLRIRVKCFTDEKSPHVDSVTPLFPCANWYERETYDMHGIIFDGHPDLRRMYMPEDFIDPNTGEPLYPLRKEFPMMGIPGSNPLPERN
jgi:NADH-quinone oxidoreductase subunit C